MNNYKKKTDTSCNLNLQIQNLTYEQEENLVQGIICNPEIIAFIENRKTIYIEIIKNFSNDTLTSEVEGVLKCYQNILDLEDDRKKYLKERV